VHLLAVALLVIKRDVDVDGAGCRQDSDNTLCCPVCKVTLRPGDFTSHVQLELDKLSKISRFTPAVLFSCIQMTLILSWQLAVLCVHVLCYI